MKNSDILLNCRFAEPAGIVLNSRSLLNQSKLKQKRRIYWTADWLSEMLSIQEASGKDNGELFMRRDVSVEDISDGRLYSANDMAKLGNDGCNGCHECCSMGPVIYLDPYDVFHLEKGLGEAFAGLIGRTAELTLADGLILPVLRLRAEEEGGEPVVCPYLGEDGRCRIHSFRPGICRLYPLGRSWENDDFHYILQTGECSRQNGSKVKIRKWLGIPGLEKYEAFCRSWHALLGKARMTADSFAESGDLAADKMRKQVCMILLKTFYLTAWDISGDFYGQFEQRCGEALKALGYA